MSGSTPAPLRVAVIGGGIGGVAAALFMTRAGIDVTVYEQATELKEIGAGIQVSPNAVRLLERAGLGAEFAKVSAVPDVIWQFHRWQSGDVVFEHVIDDADRLKWGAPYYLLRRSALLDLMVRAVPDSVFQLGRKCVAAEEVVGGVRLTIEGSDARPVYDAVIVADGNRSRLRSSLFGYDDPTYSGYFAFRAVADVADTPLPIRPITTGVWLGPDRHFVHYPVDQGRTINLVCAVPMETWPYETGSVEGDVSEFLAAFEGWNPTVRSLISATKSTRKYGLFYGDAYPTWTKGPVALLGDAAHPMLSFFAQGSAQAIEDAAVLGRCLIGIAPAGVGEALKRYEAIRKPRADAVQENANARRDSYHFPDGPEQVARDERLAAADPMGAHSWVYEYDVQAAAEEYLAMAEGPA